MADTKAENRARIRSLQMGLHVCHHTQAMLQRQCPELADLIFRTEEPASNAAYALMRDFPDYAPIMDGMVKSRGTVRSLRFLLKDRDEPTRSGIAANVRMNARDLIRAALPRSPKSGDVIGEPAINCSKGEQSRIIANCGTGSVFLPIHWLRSVDAHGLAICDWGKSKVLIVRARRQRSSFLAEMGITYFEVDGLRMGTNADAVTGYAFVGKNCKPVFNPNFQAGVKAIKERMAMATLAEFGEA